MNLKHKKAIKAARKRAVKYVGKVYYSKNCNTIYKITSYNTHFINGSTKTRITFTLQAFSNKATIPHLYNMTVQELRTHFVSMDERAAKVLYGNTLPKQYIKPKTNLEQLRQAYKLLFNKARRLRKYISTLTTLC